MLSLSVLYSTKGYYVRDVAGCLLIGFKAVSVSFIVKEIRNCKPLGVADANKLYGELQPIGKQYGCRNYRVIAYGGYTSDALAFELHGLTISDARYVESLASDRHIELFPHNEAAYRAIEAGFACHQIGAVVQATGTGKSYLIARYIAEHASAKILVIAPNVTILNEIRRTLKGKLPEEQILYRTFQALVRARKRGEVIEAEHILIDEFHHFGAEIWGKAVQEVIESNPGAKVLGTSATPVRPEGMIDTVDVYFEGNLFYELTLPEAWYYGILPVPLLVQSVYGLDDRLNEIQRALDRSGCSETRRRHIQRRLDAARMDFTTSLGAAELIRRFLPSVVRKLLVFCRDKEDLQQMKPEVMEWLKQAGFPAVAFEVHNDRNDRENNRTLKAFRQESDRLHVLFSINMLIEGLHVEGVDAALFLRRTESYVVTLQQLGRCLKTGSNRQPVILDFVNNLSGKSVYDVLACDWERISVVRSPERFEGAANFQVTGFFSDIQQRVREILAELEPWQIMYERLLEYHALEKDWPSASEGKLGLWCHTQRMAWKRGTLAAERTRQLEAIGFEWECHDSQWTKQYKKLKAFYQEEKRWPKRGEGSMSTWCNTQRQARKNGRLTKERIRRLDAIGFVWEYDLEKEWQQQYEALKAFRQENGRWPKTTEGGNLGTWCVTQRKFYRKGLLSAERIALLDTIGFVWSTAEIWMDNLRRLEAFYKQEGRWPMSGEGALGRWGFVQKRLFRKGELTADRQERLLAIGFLSSLDCS